MPASSSQNTGNRTLTNMSIGFMSGDNMVGDRILPVLPTGTGETFKYFEYDQGAFTGRHAMGAGDNAGLRMKGDTYERRDFGGSETSGLCQEYGYEAIVDKRDQTESKLVGYDALQDAMIQARVDWMLDRERRAAALLFNATTFSGVTAALSGSYQWDNVDSNPITQALTAKKSIRRSAAWAFPGRIFGLLVGAEVDDALRDNDALVERIKYTQKIDMISDANIAAYFGVQEYVVGEGVYNSAADDGAGAHTGADIWGKFALFYVRPSSPGRRIPALGYCHTAEKYMQEQYYSPDRRSDVVRARDVSIYKLGTKYAGYLWSDAIS